MESKRTEQLKIMCELLVPIAEAGKANGTNAASSASGAKTRSHPNSEYVLYSYKHP